MSDIFVYNEPPDDFFENGHMEARSSQYSGSMSPDFPPTTIESRNSFHRMASSSPDSYHELLVGSKPMLWNHHSPSFDSPRVENAPPRPMQPFHQQPPPPPLASPPLPPPSGYPYIPPHPPPMTPSGYHHHLTYHPPVYYGAPYWPPPLPMVEYIRNIQSDDVLSGRGGATNSHKGNRAFRALVKQHQDEYLKAKKRDKPAVASRIVELIRQQGGRFLRRWDTDAAGHVLWVDIGDERAREKTCQALREGAPELRRRQKASSSSDEEDDDTKRSSKHTIPSTVYSKNETPRGPKSTELTETTRLPYDDTSFPIAGEIVIRPLAQLMQDRSIDPIPLDQLSTEDRDLYLRDFWPPSGSSQPPAAAFARCSTDTTAVECATMDAVASRNSSPHIHV